MATSRAFRRPARVFVLAAAASFALTLAPTAGYAEPAVTAPTAAPAPAAPAAPATVAEVQQQIGALNRQLEIVTEQYNDASIALSESQAEVTATRAQLAIVQLQLGDLDSQVRVVAANAYKGDQLASFSAMMSSGSPQEFLDRLTTLDAISRHSNGVLTGLTEAQQQAAVLSTRADAALATAQATSLDLQTKKDFIEGQLPTLETLMASLSASERQAALDAAHPSPAAGSSGGAPAPAPASADEQSSLLGAPTDAARIAVSAAYDQLGKPYQWAAAGPNAFDCSGLTMYSYAQAGISLPHSSQAQYGYGVAVPRDQLMPGDLVFFYSPISHVAIYIGDGNMITAPQSGDVVKIQSISVMSYTGARRIANG